MTQRLAHTSFLRHLLAYAASEVAAKASRLVVVVVVARSLSPEAIGLAAAALAAGEILKALTENGVGQMIIQAPPAELEKRCNSAHRIFWVWCGALFLLQLAIAAFLYAIGHETLALLLAFLAGEYLFMPAGLVQAALAMREGKLQQTAAIAGGQVVGANVTAALLALLWASPLALVLPRLLAAPIWLVLMRRLRPWAPDAKQGFAALRPFVGFGCAVLGVEVVKVLRLQADKLVVGVMLGAESLGIYFMAFNAGLGLATSFTQAFSVVLFPHLCVAPDKTKALRHGLGTSLLVLSPLVLLQAALAPVYVPLLLGAEWHQISPVVSVLCLAALPSVIWSAVAGWLRSENRAFIELRVSAALAFALILNTAIMAPFGLMPVAIGYLLTSTALMLTASWLLLPRDHQTTEGLRYQ
ncbi:oligosaccharide flippase family protein [Ruegeria lacuscaerulensis]|uniref:oligosaccharide flippase family protein n=1 Tax=Ruegeria lacuscaerulensis TaxID=55218 RepID=UPI00147D7482|nr:oligosaccharide flippase family protein [Ruegeria lacuscaerulensis]